MIVIMAFIVANSSAVELTVVFGAALMWIGGVAYFVRHILVRLVSQVEFSDTIRVRTFAGTGVISWTEVGRLTVDDRREKMLGENVEIRVITVEGDQFSIWAPVRFAEDVLELASSKPWAQHWSGLPMDKKSATAILLVGLIALLAGAFAIYRIALDLLVDAPPSIPGQWRLSIAAYIYAVLAPIGGTVGIAYGMVHLIRRPICFRPWVGTISQER